MQINGCISTGLAARKSERYMMAEHGFCDHYLEIGILSGWRNQLFIVRNIGYSSELFGINPCEEMDDLLMVSCAALLLSGLQA